MKKRSVVIWLLGAAIVILITISVFLPGRSHVASAAVSAANGTPFVPVKRGTLARTVRVGGTLAAVHFGGISAPAIRGQRFQLTLIRLAEAGKVVQAGDVVAEFDRQAQRTNYEDHEAEYNSQNDQILKRKSELKIEREKQLSDLQKAKADKESAELETHRNEVVSKIDAEKNNQALAEAVANLKMQQETLDLRQTSAVAEIKLLEIKRDREKLAMEQARINFERLIVKAPVGGLVVYNSMWKGNRMAAVAEGDQIWPGSVFMQIVDTSAMGMRARINQLDAKFVQIGGPATIHLDAYPDVTLPGKVETLSPLGQNGTWGDRTRVFGMTISVQGRDVRLIPDISASADVEIERIPDALLVPRAAVARIGSGDFVWVQTAAGQERRQVTLGIRDDQNWAVQKGLNDGDLVAAVAPTVSPEVKK